MQSNIFTSPVSPTDSPNSYHTPSPEKLALSFESFILDQDTGWSHSKNSTSLPSPAVLPMYQQGGGSPTSPTQMDRKYNKQSYRVTTNKPRTDATRFRNGANKQHSQPRPARSRSRPRSRSRKEEDPSKYELDIEKVKRGLDTRTTLMIKNIPNKYDQQMLLQAVDKNHKGTYDFFYLPIDFKNKCNVGYAFINFIDPTSIVTFYEDFNNKKWEKFNSEKVCKLTYARIQGKDCMIVHFKNSSLLFEDPKCRPLIFRNCSDGGTYDWTDRLQPFPIGMVATVVRPRRKGSDSNQSKHKKDREPRHISNGA